MASNRNQSNNTESYNALTELSHNSLSHNGAEQGCISSLNGASVAAAEHGSLRSLNESISHFNLNDQSSPAEDLVSDDETQNQGSDEPDTSSAALDDGCAGSASSATIRPISEAGGLSTQPEIPAGMDVHDQVGSRATHHSSSGNRPSPSPIGHPRRSQGAANRRTESGTRPNMTLFDSLLSMNVGAGVPSGRGPVPAVGSLGSLFGGFGSNPRSPGPRAHQSARPIERPRLSPRDTLGSGGPRPVPTLFGHITNTLQQAQAGPSNVGTRYRAPRSSDSQTTRQPGRLAVPPPHILELMAAEINSSHQTSEQDHFVNAIMDMHQQDQETLMLQELLNVNPLPHPRVMFPHINTRRDRVDVDQMSYEELLALGDEIGNVRTGLREEIIMAHLRQRNYEVCTGEPSEPSASETCPICREVYIAGESIGTLDCNHEFHTDCIKMWLTIKNECPVCKMKGLDA
ncbi:E3 ubiquitin-protein ligase MBR2-like [Silene latifolia]|uniref:E3 ubiquitin-protein ligase MBR2-like n=1 Tax=Silene latifolia TaxID=37657 RepID=UPI003D77978D